MNDAIKVISILRFLSLDFDTFGMVACNAFVEPAREEINRNPSWNSYKKEDSNFPNRRAIENLAAQTAYLNTIRWPRQYHHHLLGSKQVYAKFLFHAML